MDRISEYGDLCRADAQAPQPPVPDSYRGYMFEKALGL
jgi:hypothetical protein